VPERRPLPRIARHAAVTVTRPAVAAAGAPATPAPASASGRPLRILVVDDDPAMVGAVTALVGTEGHQVVTAYDGTTAIRRWREDRPDLVLLDLAMPGPDGFEVARSLRAEGATLPIIIVSGERGEPAKVRALDLGADDYLTKPFGKDELLARIRAAVRRAALSTSAAGGGFEGRGPIRVGNLLLDPSRHASFVEDRELGLTPTEYRLLEVLAQAGGELLGHARLLVAGWPSETDPDPLWLKPHLARLRRKLVKAGGPGIVSVRAVGWRLVVDGARDSRRRRA
jgi:two-component system, OmpR family, KDP operon response regulator KdpE